MVGRDCVGVERGGIRMRRGNSEGEGMISCLRWR